jgi:hypothetical protein
MGVGLMQRMVDMLILKTCIMDKLNLDLFFNSRSGFIDALHLVCTEPKVPSLELKTGHKQPLGFLQRLYF